MVRRLLPSFALAAVLCGVGTVASAQAWPGECVTRRVTGPGGAYRWDRVECEAQAGGSGFERWGHGPRPLDVVEGPPPDGLLLGDRYGGWRHAPAYPAYEDGPYREGPYAVYPTYRVAGRDEDGFLVWPGKLP
jgi:hypothetical protein